MELCPGTGGAGLYIRIIRAPPRVGYPALEVALRMQDCICIGRTEVHCLRTDHIASIVDDDEAVRVATASLVRSFGWQVHVFASAETFYTPAPSKRRHA